MKKYPEGLTKNIASSRNWFRQKLLPDEIKLRRQSLWESTQVQCYDGIKLIFVEHGAGTLIVNGKGFPLQRGSCCLLYCFHFHKIVPASGSPLRISVCHISYNTFLFATIVPGYHLIELEQSEDPVVTVFSQPQQHRVRQILSGMEAMGLGNDTQYALLYELLGRLCRAFAARGEQLQTKP